MLIFPPKLYSYLLYLVVPAVVQQQYDNCSVTSVESRAHVRHLPLVAGCQLIRSRVLATRLLLRSSSICILLLLRARATGHGVYQPLTMSNVVPAGTSKSSIGYASRHTRTMHNTRTIIVRVLVSYHSPRRSDPRRRLIPCVYVHVKPVYSSSIRI